MSIIRSFHPGIINEMTRKVTRFHKEIGLSAIDCIVVNSFLNCTVEWEEISLEILSNETGLDKDTVRESVIKFGEKTGIALEESNLGKIQSYLETVFKQNTSVRERVEIEENAKREFLAIYGLENYGKSDSFADVTISCTEEGILIRNNQGYYWSLRDTEKLAKELLATIPSYSEENITKYNQNLKDKKEKISEIEREESKERQKQREEEQKRRDQGTPGFIVLFRIFPSGLYKFSYTTSSTLQRKIELIKEQNGDNTQIIHSVEVANTSKFFHQFIKKQYSNRLLDNKYYELNQEDVQFFESEEYPPQAMEWFRGT